MCKICENEYWKLFLYVFHSKIDNEKLKMLCQFLDIPIKLCIYETFEL